MKELFDFFFKGDLFWKIVLLIWSLLSTLFVNAQVDRNSELFKTLKSKDSIIFERTFNKCELQKLDDIIDQDFEFYHDLGGIENREDFFKSVQKNICGNKNEKPIRKLVDNSIKVYPLTKNGKLYGAIQKGKHTFHIKKNNKLIPTGSALFTHVWILNNNIWKLKRVLSYNHLPVQN
ncbi:nuclear transport factor 2 family protein [uncultured Tenacibaculum sp.]|uniref:nuclear transport factor 2 family protein n=1 Tax=uncultured Tenacibaculum sp. TaxID=174713 RepID=UPI002636AAD7|nr:nuclear transport factor 2 family protein [uncultured Tenacibaculum sp.]